MFRRLRRGRNCKQETVVHTIVQDRKEDGAIRHACIDSNGANDNSKGKMEGSRSWSVHTSATTRVVNLRCEGRERRREKMMGG